MLGGGIIGAISSFSVVIARGSVIAHTSAGGLSQSGMISIACSGIFVSIVLLFLSGETFGGVSSILSLYISRASCSHIVVFSVSSGLELTSCSISPCHTLSLVFSVGDGVSSGVFITIASLSSLFHEEAGMTPLVFSISLSGSDRAGLSQSGIEWELSSTEEDQSKDASVAREGIGSREGADEARSWYTPIEARGSTSGREDLSTGVATHRESVMLDGVAAISVGVGDTGILVGLVPLFVWAMESIRKSWNPISPLLRDRR